MAIAGVTSPLQLVLQRAGNDFDQFVDQSKYNNAVRPLSNRARRSVVASLRIEPINVRFPYFCILKQRWNIVNELKLGIDIAVKEPSDSSPRM